MVYPYIFPGESVGHICSLIFKRYYKHYSNNLQNYHQENAFFQLIVILSYFLYNTIYSFLFQKLNVKINKRDL